MLSRIGLDRVDAVLTLGMFSWNVEKKKTNLQISDVGDITFCLINFYIFPCFIYIFFPKRIAKATIFDWN